MSKLSRRNFGKWILKGGILVPLVNGIIPVRAQIKRPNILIPLNSGGAAPTFDAASAGTSGTAVASLTYAHTCSGSNRLLFVVVGYGDTPANAYEVTGITYNAVAMTRSWVKHGTAWVHNEGWYLINPATGANNVIVTFTNSVFQCASGGVSFNGVNQTTPTGTAVTDSKSTGNPTVTVSSSTSEIVISGCSTDSQGSLDVTGGPTRRWRIQNVGSDTDFGASTLPGAASSVMGWTHTTGNEWTEGAVAIKP